jgi:hypothetical protein
MVLERAAAASCSQVLVESGRDALEGRSVGPTERLAPLEVGIELRAEGGEPCGVRRRQPEATTQPRDAFTDGPDQGEVALGTHPYRLALRRHDRGSSAAPIAHAEADHVRW